MLGGGDEDDMVAGDGGAELDDMWIFSLAFSSPQTLTALAAFSAEKILVPQARNCGCGKPKHEFWSADNSVISAAKILVDNPFARKNE